MKPPPFTYHRPLTLQEALDVLGQVGVEGRVLAGGQSLIPLLNERRITPAHLVDINRVAGLSDVRVERDGVQVGATVRHTEVEAHKAAHALVPLLRQGLRWVAHPAVRNRGTVVGSLAHADPGAEMTAVLALLEGTVELARTGHWRTVAARDLIVSAFKTCIEPGELAVSAYFPRPPDRTGTAFVEASRRSTDAATCALAAAVTLDEDARITAARGAYVAVAETPVVLDLTDPLVSTTPATANWESAALLARERISPGPDLHASAEYRRHLVGVLTARALRSAALRAADTLTTDWSLEPTP
ncbi:FAD binding domain-containing protein [Streptomyces sp. NPDC015127]|uniref:FAD binding domain-containing protein n=1 Tax=Streptomyces sp. NPDC015127 TaxID=3364939 RepID=UPI0036F93DAD